MLFKEIKPYVRYVRILNISQKSVFDEFYPLDARLFYLAEGKGKIKINNTIFALSPGDIAYINAGTKYLLLPSDCSYIAINFDFTNLFNKIDFPITPLLSKNADKKLLIEQINFTDIPRFNDYFIFNNCRFLEMTLLKLKSEYEKKLPFFEIETSSLLTSVLIDLARFSEQRDAKNRKFNIEEVITFIHEHFNEEIDNKSLAELFHYHPNYLSSEFKRCLGLPLHAYLLQTRIFKAVNLIESDFGNISQIATTCGFKDTNYFARYFKKVTGVSPSKFIGK